MGGDNNNNESSSGSESPEEGPPKEVSKKDKKKEQKKEHRKKESKKNKKKRSREEGGDEDRGDSSRKQKKQKKEKKKEKKEARKEDAPPRREVPVRLDAQDDYYSRATEFRVWLRLVKRKNFEELKREEAQELFESFVSAWNKGKLADMFYDGIPAHIRGECTKTTHKWGFVNKLNETEKFQLDSLGDRVGAASYSSAAVQKAAGVAPQQRASHTGNSAQPNRSSAGDATLAREEARAEKRAMDKALREKTRVVMDELAPKSTGREAQIDARKAKGDRLHGASRAADESRDGLDMSESALGLGGDDDLQARVARSKQAQQRRMNEKEKRISDLQKKEQDSMAKFMAQMGLKPGQKITIPKRQPEGEG